MQKLPDGLMDFIRKNDIIQHEEVRLASGKISNIYCDAKKILLDSEGIYRSVPSFFRLLSETTKFDAIGGIELGCVPLIGAILMHCASYAPGNHLRGFIVRKQRKEHGTQRIIEGPVQPGMEVAIIEDVVTTGSSAYQAYWTAKDFGLKPVLFGAIINRGEGASELLESTGLPFVYLLDKKQLVL